MDIPHLDSLSGSQIGKPGVALAWDKFNQREKEQPTFAMKRKWVGGHMFELEVMHLLERLGYDYEWQPDIKVFGMISGHPDFVVTNEDGSRFLIECKHVGAGKYEQYRKGMNNIQYITQFALYCSHYSCGGMWVIGNADTGEMCTLVVPTYERVLQLYQNYIVTAVNTYQTISTAESFNHALRSLKMPEPLPRKDGTWGIMPALYERKGELHPCCCLYNYILDDKGRYTVIGYNYPAECKDLEPTLQ